MLLLLRAVNDPNWITTGRAIALVGELIAELAIIAALIIVQI